MFLKKQIVTRITGLLCIGFLVFLSGCHSNVSTSILQRYPALAPGEEIAVFELNHPEPAGAEVLGYVKIGEADFASACGYDAVLELAKKAAREAGGNAIKIFDHRRPDYLYSSCHRLSATILAISDLEKLFPEEDEINPDLDHAILNVYRYPGPGAHVSYKLFVNDSTVCLVKNNYKTTLALKLTGTYYLWARVKTKDQVQINFEKGKTYYLRCGFQKGHRVGDPQLELVDRKTGQYEFESFEALNE